MVRAHLAAHLEQVGLLESLEAEVVVLEVAVVHDGRVELVLVILDDAFQLVGDERAMLAGLGVDVPVQLVHGLAEGLGGLLVHVRDSDARGKLAVVGVLRRQERRRLRGKVVQLRRADAIKDTRDHLLRDNDGVDVLGVEAVAQLLDARGDLVKGHRLFLPIALDHQHLEASLLVVWTCGCGATHGVRPQQSIACVQHSTRYTSRNASLTQVPEACCRRAVVCALLPRRSG